MSSLETVQDYVKDVRTLVQDKIQPYRYGDHSILTAFNVTLMEARRLRPDLFLGFRDMRPPAFDTISDDEVEIEEPFRLAIVHGVVGHVLARDEEDIQDARAAMFLATFGDMLLGLKAGISAVGTPGQPKKAGP